MNDLLSMSESRCGQFLTNRMYVQAYEEGWCGPECQKQLTYREQQELWPKVPESMVSTVHDIISQFEPMKYIPTKSVEAWLSQ